MQPNPDHSLESEASADQASSSGKPRRTHRLWTFLVVLLLAAALVLFVLDRLGFRLPGSGPEQPVHTQANSSAPQDQSPSAAPAASSMAGLTGSGPGAPTDSAPAAPAPKPAPSFVEQQGQIQALIGQVQALPSYAQAPTPVRAETQEPAAAAPNSGAPTTTGALEAQDPLTRPSVWSRLSDSLSELFVVRRMTPSAQPLLDARGEAMARQETRLLLLSARLSLMMGQPLLARADLATAQAMLPRYFRMEDPSVQAFADRLSSLAASLPSSP